MSSLIHDHFLLRNKTAEKLYHQYAAELPIIDYHCHLNPQEIYENKTYRNLTEVWLYGDHYKWRAMRANGVEEKFVTGSEGADDYGRFLAWAETVPMTVGNPLYHWSHLELSRIFGIDDPINGRTAPAIWEKANASLNGEGFSVRDLIRKAKVEVICTTDDPADDLGWHLKLREEKDLGFLVLPSFRPDKAIYIAKPDFRDWLEKLKAVSGERIDGFDAFLGALERRVAFFHSVGCRVSDHALDTVPFLESTREQAGAAFEKALRGEAVGRDEEERYKTYLLIFLGRLYAERGWSMQYHMHAHRNNNTRMFGKLGPDTGFDSMNTGSLAGPLVRLLDALDRDDALPRTILYSLNPADNDVLAAIIGSFQGGGIPGKMQFGSAWWFNDTKDGMTAQLKSLANMGLLSRFVGMLTDSRSFLSYTRHEYFRRILCNLLGEWVESGEVADDPELLRDIVERVCYRNAKAYFRFGE